MTSRLIRLDCLESLFCETRARTSKWNGSQQFHEYVPSQNSPSAFARAVGPTLAFGGVSCPQGARASASDLRPSRTRATGAPSPRRLTRRSCREPSAAPSERWRTDRLHDARLRTRRRTHAVPTDATSSLACSARVQAPRPLRMAQLSIQPHAERLAGQPPPAVGHGRCCCASLGRWGIELHQP